jgi:SHS2 domain-containing protein
VPAEPTESGHRLLPHTADLRLEAWAATREDCFDQAVRALAESFVEPATTAPRREVPVLVLADQDDALLAALLEEAIYAVEVLGLVPLAATLTAADDAGLAGWFDAVPVSAVELVGSVPKAVSRGDLEVTGGDAGWRCLVTVDV